MKIERLFKNKVEKVFAISFSREARRDFQLPRGVIRQRITWNHGLTGKMHTAHWHEFLTLRKRLNFKITKRYAYIRTALFCKKIHIFHLQSGMVKLTWFEGKFLMTFDFRIQWKIYPPGTLVTSSYVPQNIESYNY